MVDTQKAPRGRSVEVTVAPANTVYIDGIAYCAGQTVKVSQADAKTLREQGSVD